MDRREFLVQGGAISLAATLGCERKTATTDGLLIFTSVEIPGD